MRRLYLIWLVIKVYGSASMAILLVTAPNFARSDSQGNRVDLTGIPFPYSFNHYCRPNSDVLWAVGGEGTVQHTDRTGTSNRQITDKSLNGVYFKDSYVGWVVGDSGTIVHTRNRGVDWQIQKTGVIEDLYAVTCDDKDRCWAVGRQGLILRTLDQGTHWELLKSGTSATLFAINFVDDQSGWAVGEDGLVIHTSDGGNTWGKQHAIIVLFPNGPFAEPSDLRAVIFSDRKRGWVAGAGGIARTEDGGETWIPTEIEGTSFIGLASTNGKSVWAISSRAANYVTKDGGVTWAR